MYESHNLVQPTHTLLLVNKYKRTSYNMKQSKSDVDMLTNNKFHVSISDLLNIALHPLLKLASDVLDLPLC